MHCLLYMLLAIPAAAGNGPVLHRSFDRGTVGDALTGSDRAYWDAITAPFREK